MITAMKVFLDPSGITWFGPNLSGLVNLLVSLALMYILFKIPFWFLGRLRGSGGRSLIGSLVRGFIAYKTFGLFGGRGGGGRTSRPSGGGARGANGGGGGGPADPHTRTTADGQYVLPLTGVRRSRPAATPKPVPSAAKPRTGQGQQLFLPLGDDWPENRPVLGRDGQYRLPLDVQRVRPTPPSAWPGQPGTGGRRRGGQQWELPFDPYKSNRATRSGQYPLPTDGLRRAAPAKPEPATPPPRPATPVGKQLRLPLDLPKPPRRTPPPKPGGKK